MINISEDYKNILNKKTSLKSRSKIVVENREYISEIKSSPKISHKNKTIIGGFPIKTCSFELMNTENNVDFLDKEVKVYKGIEVNNNFEYVLQGIFIPKKSQIKTNISQKTISFESVQDKGQLFDIPYVSKLNWDVKHTGEEIVQEICDLVDVELATLNFNWSKYYFDKPNFKDGVSCREVISRIAEIGGSIAIINYEGKLEIKSQKYTDQSISAKRYSKLSKEKKYGEINVVILGKKDVNDDIYYPENLPIEKNEHKIIDNPFVDLHRKEMISEVAKYILGLSLTPFEIEKFIDGFCYELNDVISITDKNNNSFNGVILNYETNGRISSKIGADVQDSTLTNYKLAGSTKQELVDVRLDVDNNKKRIDAVVSEQKQIEKDIITSKTAEGNPIEIDDAGEYPLKSIKIEGKSQGVINYLKNEGKTTSMNGVTYTFNEDGSITIKGTATDTSYAMILGESLFDYSKERFKIETDYVASGWYNSNIRLIGRGTDSKYYNIYQGNVADIKNVPLSLVYIQVVTGATIDETIYPMISNKASSFIPPGTWLKLVSSNKNLFNSNDCITFNGHIANGILSYNSGNKVLVFPCAPNKKYVISKKSGDRFRIGSYPTFANKGITLNNYISNDNTNILTITTGSNDKYLYIEYWVNIEEESEKEIINSIQIETNEPTEYIAHEEHIALIDLNIYNDSGNIIAHHEINDGEIFKNGVLSKKDGEIHNLPYTILNINKGYNYVTLNDELYPNMEIEYLLDSKLNDTYVSKSQFAMESDKIHLEVSKKLDNIDIGGTNLLPGTQLLDNSKIDIKSNLKLNAYKNFSSSSLDLTNSTINYDDCLRWYETLTLEPNNEYTLSFYAKGTKVRTYIYPDAILQGTSSQGLSTNITDGRIEFSLTSEWRKYWVTYKTLSNISGKKSLLFRVLKGENAEICGVKLEHGNKTTDWDPSPNDIKAELELKVSKNDNDQIVSMLNASADEITLAGGSKINISTAGKLIISAGNFRLDAAGNITATGGTIGGFSLSKNSFSTNINGIYDYDRNDINVVQQMLLWPSYFEAIKNIYDANNDGKLDALDLLIVQKIIDKTMSNNKKVSGIFTINTANPKHCITLSAYGQTLFDLGIGMLYVANADFGQASVGGRNIIVGDDEGDCIWQLWIQQGASPRLVIETYNTAYAVGLSTSDQRLKHDIDFTKIKALPLIEKINHREFVYNNDENNELVKIGYIADELQEIDEQLVFEVGKDKIKQINQLYLEALLSKGEQELYQLFKKQQEQIDELKDRVTKLEKERGNYEEIK